MKAKLKRAGVLLLTVNLLVAAWATPVAATEENTNNIDVNTVIDDNTDVTEGNSDEDPELDLGKDDKKEENIQDKESEGEIIEESEEYKSKDIISEDSNSHGDIEEKAPNKTEDIAIQKKTAAEKSKSIATQSVSPISGNLESSRGTSVYIDRGVTLTVSCTGGDGNYEYQFTEVYDGKEKVVQEYSENSQYVFKTVAPGAYTYYADIRDKSGNTQRLTYAMTVTVHPDYNLRGTLTSSRQGNVYIDRGVTLTAGSTGGYGTVEYQFSEVYNGQTKVLQEYGTKDTYEFKTSGSGVHTYYVDIRDERGQSVRLSYAMTVTVHPDCVLRGTLSSSRSGNVYIDRGVTLTAGSTGGYGTIEYQFSEVYNGQTKVLQEYGTKDTYGFKTSGSGVHTYYVDIRDERGQSVRLSYAMTVTVHPDCVLRGTLSSSRSGNVYIDRGVTLTAGSTGGYGTIEYQFSEVYNGQTKVLQEYGTKDTYGFKTSGSGVHTYYVDIRDESGQSVRLSYVMTVTLHPDYVLKGTLTSSRSGNVYVDRGVTLTGESTGGYGTVEYQFTEAYNGKETVVQEYGIKNTYEFKTNGPGQHTYYVDIRDEEGQRVRLTYSMTVTVHPDYVLKGTLTSSRSGNVYIDRGVTLTGESTGGYGTVEYQFTEVYNGEEKVLQEYGTKNTYGFQTIGPGLHTYYLDIRDDGGQYVRLTYSLTVTVHPDYILNGSLSFNRTGNVYVGRGMVLTASSIGGYGDTQYQFIEAYGRQQKVVQEYSSNSVYEFRSTKPGIHVFFVDMRDNKGQTIRLQCNLQVTVHPDYKLSGNFTSDAGNNVKENQRITLTVSSKGGYGEKRLYQFRELYNGKINVLQLYNTSSTYSFKIKGMGQHTYYADIKDEEGQVITLTLNISIGKNGWFYEGGYKFYYKNGVKQLDLDGILPKQSSYYIKVNRQACTVTVYAKDGNNGYIIPVKRFACSVGKASTPTPTGTFYTSNKYRWHTLMGPSYGQYCTRIVGGVLFHSVAGRNMTSYNLNARDYNMLGSPASHGCVRLCVRDAKWIYDNCKSGTMVTIYDSASPGPLGKPATIKIPAGQTWDPTDPNL